MFGILSLFAYYLGREMTGSVEGGQTLTFMVLALSQIIQAFNMRSSKSLFKIGFFTNKMLNKAAIISLGLTLLVIFTPICHIFGLVKMPPLMYLLGFGLSLVPLCIIELSKTLKLIKD